jgi:hypothetical protein
MILKYILDLELGATLCGLGYNGIIKLLGALNLPPPTQQ